MRILLNDKKKSKFSHCISIDKSFNSKTTPSQHHTFKSLIHLLTAEPLTKKRTIEIKKVYPHSKTKHELWNLAFIVKKMSSHNHMIEQPTICFRKFIHVRFWITPVRTLSKKAYLSVGPYIYLERSQETLLLVLLCVRARVFEKTFNGVRAIN